MHVANTERIITQILRQPERFDMGDWVKPALVDEAGELVVDVCGTAACIGGWSRINHTADQLLGHGQTDPIVAHYDAVHALVDEGASGAGRTGLDHLDLPRGGERDSEWSPSCPLFYVSDWPDHYNELTHSRWDVGFDPEALAAAMLLRDMLDGNVVLADWERRSDSRNLRWWRQFASTTQEG